MNISSLLRFKIEIMNETEGMNEMIQVSELSHHFTIGKKDTYKEIPVVQHVNFQVEEGEVVSIVGRSGSGKSTLLHLLAGFMQPIEGRILLNKTELTAMNEEQRAQFRLQLLGFIFQNFQLLPGLTAYENVEFPLVLMGIEEQERKVRVDEIMERVGLTSVGPHYPNELSGGQQQRVGIARALINRPAIILADEPTGSLDSETEKDILMLIQSLNQKEGITFIIITHDEAVAQAADRTYTMHDGQLIGGERL